MQVLTEALQSLSSPKLSLCFCFISQPCITHLKSLGTVSLCRRLGSILNHLWSLQSELSSQTNANALGFPHLAVTSPVFTWFSVINTFCRCSALKVENPTAERCSFLSTSILLITSSRGPATWECCITSWSNPALHYTGVMCMHSSPLWCDSLDTHTLRWFFSQELCCPFLQYSFFGGRGAEQPNPSTMSIYFYTLIYSWP